MSPTEETSPIIPLQQKLEALEQRNRILQKKLMRSERTRTELETASQRRELMLKQVILEAEAAKAELEIAKEAADHANKAKSEFLANMSHELRTPLNGILGYAKILSRTEVLSEKGKIGLNTIYQCGDHLLTLINDILDLSKIEAHKMDLLEEPLELPSFIQSVVAMCRVRAEQKGLAFIHQADAQLPTSVLADERRLRQVLLNLLGNAVKFTDVGKIIFRVQLIHSAPQTRRYHLRFEVQDTGIGISAAQLDKICLPFEQVGDVHRKEGGTGLGLAISSQIIQMMGSQLHIDSQPGLGSTFSFEVELSAVYDGQAASLETHGQQIIGYQGGKRTILVVDDRWENRSVIVNLLQPIGFEVIEATDGEQGLAQAKAVQPDLMLIDLLMPIMNGFELLKALQHDEQLQTIPKIVSSASVFEADQQASLAAGALAFLPEPINVDHLLSLLQTHLHLDWIYGNLTNPQDSGTMSSTVLTINPPPQTVQKLKTLVRKGDLDTLVAEAQGLDEQYKRFAQTVITLAESFQVKQLKAFLAQNTQGTGSIECRQ
jgi:signal transduction histidine kinase/DNA-binding response OmpR family regulator